MSLLYKAKELKEGYNCIVSPANADLKYLEFGRLVLPAGATFEAETGACEESWDVLYGQCTVEVSGAAFETVGYEAIGGRKDVLAGNPATVYLPRNAKIKVKVLGAKLEVAIFKAPARRDTPPAYIAPDATLDATVGKLNWTRDVVTTIGPNVDADRLLVGETWSRAGCWSSFPPHKHDTDNPPEEAWYEEVYFFLVRPSQGFGIQRLYTSKDAADAMDEVYVIEDGDTVVLPRGYHPVASAPGYRLWYYWGLAGEERQYAAWSDDPAHSWIRGVEPMV